MSIQKKSLISTLKTAKKANVASSHEVDAKGSKISSMRLAHAKGTLQSAKSFNAKSFTSAKNVSAKNITSAKNVSAKNVTSAKNVSAKRPGA